MDPVRAHLGEDIRDSLLILHDINDWDTWKALKDTFLRDLREQRILAITHNKQIAAAVASPHVFVLGEFDEDSAISLLCNQLEDKTLVNDGSTTALISKLAYLPLAITQAAVHLNENPGLTISKYLETLDKEEFKIINLLSNSFMKGQRGVDSPDAVETTWFAPFNQLQTLNPSAAIYLKLMASIGFQDIPIRFLPPLESEFETINARGILGAFHFMNNHTEAENSMMLHPLVRLAARCWMRENHEFEQYLQRATNRLEMEFSITLNENRQLWRQYLPHVMFVLNERVVPVGPNHDDLPWRTAHCLWNDGRFTEAQKLSIKFMEQRRKQYGDQDPSSLTYMSWVAYTYSELQQWEMAEDLQLQVLKTCREMLGTEHTDTLSSMTHLARVYSAEGNWNKAEQLHLQIIDISEQLYHMDHSSILKCLTEVAATLRRFRKRKEELALRLYIFRAQGFLGESHPDTIRCKHEMALAHYAYSTIGVENAKDILKEIIKMWREFKDGLTQVTGKQSFGPDHPLAMASMECLTWIYETQQEWELAGKVQAEAVESYRETLGLQHPFTLTAISKLARVRWFQGRWGEAGDLLSEVVEVSRKISSLEFPSIGQGMFDLADAYERQGRQKEAEAMRQQARQTEPSRHMKGPVYSHFMARMQSLACGEPAEEVDARRLMARIARLVVKEPYSLHDHSGQIALQTLAAWQDKHDRNITRQQSIPALVLVGAGKIARALRKLAGER
ncbi:hypothetical protein BDV06DRAFT_227083 [Aspergillus oleicola]